MCAPGIPGRPSTKINVSDTAACWPPRIDPFPLSRTWAAWANRDALWVTSSRVPSNPANGR